MAKLVSGIIAGDNRYVTMKGPATASAHDIGKPVKISATDEVALCADGDQIYGFIASVETEQGTADGKSVLSILTAGRCYVILSGASAVGTLVEAAANTAVNTAKAGAFGLVSTHTLVAGTLKQWQVISGSGADGATVLIEKL